jgi:hypothetical protein
MAKFTATLGTGLPCESVTRTTNGWWSGSDAEPVLSTLDNGFIAQINYNGQTYSH